MNETIASAALLSIVFIRLFLVACHETADESTISNTPIEGASKDNENSSRSTLSNTSKLQDGMDDSNSEDESGIRDTLKGEEVDTERIW